MEYERGQANKKQTNQRHLDWRKRLKATKKANKSNQIAFELGEEEGREGERERIKAKGRDEVRSFEQEAEVQSGATIESFAIFQLLKEKQKKSAAS